MASRERAPDWRHGWKATAGREQSKFVTYFPDTGPFRRELYPKAMAFFKASRLYWELLFLAANRIGKTDAAAYALTAHLTGHYPAWWEGRVFDQPVQCWVAGDTAKTTRDVPQLALFGSVEDPAAGMVPIDMVHSKTAKSGTTEGYEAVWVKHVSGKLSRVQFKSYDQGRRAFEGTAKHVIWLDEEPPEDVYGECLLRLLTTDGLMIVTFTPLQGLTSFVSNWLEQADMVEVDGRTLPATRILDQAKRGED